MNTLVDIETLPDGKRIRVVRAKPQRKPTVVTVRMEGPRSAARDSALVYAESRLAPWAKWAQQHREQIGYPTISLLYKAMQVTKVGIIRGRAYPQADEHGQVEYPINADGHETRSLRPREIGDVPEAIAEVDTAVAKVPQRPRLVLIADYFTYGPIEERCKRTPYKRARYFQLLEVAKYAVYVQLVALGHSPSLRLDEMS
jgi:hypothetical protein